MCLISPCLCGRNLGMAQPDSHNNAIKEPSWALIISKLCWGKRSAPSLSLGWFEGFWCPQCRWPEVAFVAFHRAAFNTAVAFLKVSPRQRKTEIMVFYNLLSESVAHHFCCILSLMWIPGPSQIYGEWTIQGSEYQEAWLIESHQCNGVLL